MSSDFSWAYWLFVHLHLWSVHSNLLPIFNWFISFSSLSGQKKFFYIFLIVLPCIYTPRTKSCVTPVPQNSGLNYHKVSLSPVPCLEDSSSFRSPILKSWLLQPRRTISLPLDSGSFYHSWEVVSSREQGKPWGSPYKFPLVRDYCLRLPIV